MTPLEELLEKFSKLTEEEKAAFIQTVMPSFCEAFSKNPQKMMSEMMPFCGEMMKAWNRDMPDMLKMMGRMGRRPGTDKG